MWEGETSLVEHVAALGNVRLEGQGTLTTRNIEQESCAEAHAGTVRFVLTYEPDSTAYAHERSIRVCMFSLDDTAAEVLRKPSKPGTLLTKYSLDGVLQVPNRSFRVRVEHLFLDPETLVIRHPAADFDQYAERYAELELLMIPQEGEDPSEAEPLSSEYIEETKRIMGQLAESPGEAVEREGWAWKVTVGRNIEPEYLTGCSLLIPNLLAKVQGEIGDLNIDVAEIPEAKVRLSEPSALGRVTPGSVVRVRHSTKPESKEVKLMIDELGWLFSFYAGRAVHPMVWEAHNSDEVVYCLETKSVAPVEDSGPRSCVLRPDYDGLKAVLESAWPMWRQLYHEDDGWISTLKSFISLYPGMLSTTFPNQRIALVAMSLERIRQQALGDSDLLKGMSNSKKDKVLSEARKALRSYISGSRHLSEELKSTVKDNIKSKANEVFRGTFKESLESLCEEAEIDVEDDRLASFVSRRNSVIHGAVPGGAEPTMDTFYHAQYGLNLLEKLVLRRLKYSGSYYDRVTDELKEFEDRSANW